MHASLRAGLIAAAALVAGTISAGELRIGSPTIEGGRYTFPIELRGEVDVSALNFRLDYDPAIFAPAGAETGRAAQAADKTLASHAPEDGVLNVVLMGFNQNGVASGEVARVTLERRGELAEPSRLTISELTMANAAGEALPAQGDTRVVRPDQASAPDEPVPDTPDTPEEPTAPDAPDTPGDTGSPAPGLPSTGAPGLGPLAESGIDAAPATSLRERIAAAAGPGDTVPATPARSAEEARAAALAAGLAAGQAAPELAVLPTDTSPRPDRTPDAVAAAADGTQGTGEVAITPIAEESGAGPLGTLEESSDTPTPANKKSPMSWLGWGIAGLLLALGTVIIVLIRGAR